jgi:hypothetical protein
MPPFEQSGALDSSWSTESALTGNTGQYVDIDYVDPGYFEGPDQAGPVDSTWTKRDPL